MIMGGRVGVLPFCPYTHQLLDIWDLRNRKGLGGASISLWFGLVAQGPGGFGDSNRGAPM